MRRLTITTAALITGLGGLCVGMATAQQAEPPPKPKPAAKSATKVAAAPKRDAATTTGDVDAAQKLLAAGNVDPAVTMLTTLISGGNLPASTMARALYLRGTAYRQQSKPALAISDLTSALWLKGGLSDADRADATQQRAAAYSDAGLTDQGQAIASGATRSKAVAASEAPASSGTGFFGGLFGGGAANSPPPAPKEAAAPVRVNTVKTARAPLPQPTATLAPATATATVAVANAPAPQPKHDTPVKSGGGQFHSRIALVRTKAEAEAVIAKLKFQHAEVLGTKKPDIGETAFGNMGSFYQVRVGPYANANEAQALCGKLKGSGLDCVPVGN